MTNPEKKLSDRVVWWTRGDEVVFESGDGANLLSMNGKETLLQREGFTFKPVLIIADLYTRYDTDKAWTLRVLQDITETLAEAGKQRLTDVFPLGQKGEL